MGQCHECEEYVRLICIAIAALGHYCGALILPNPFLRIFTNFVCMNPNANNILLLTAVEIVEMTFTRNVKA
jgi:hypothetical protein